jgi:hypothetical protein
MLTTNVRIAYLKRLLRRLDAEPLRIQELIRAGELSNESASLAERQLDFERSKILRELAELERAKT